MADKIEDKKEEVPVKSAADLQREQIKVTVSKNTETDEPKEEPKEEPKNEENKEEIKEEPEAKEEKETKENAESGDDDPTKLRATIEKLQKRIGRTTGYSKDLETKLAAAEAKLAAVDDPTKLLTEDDVETRAQAKAQAIIDQNAFAEACNRLAKAAEKVDPEFMEKVDVLGKQVAPIPTRMIAILEDLDNGGAILAHLADPENHDEYEEFIQMSSERMGVRLAKLGTKLEKEADEKKKADKKNELKAKTPKLDASRVPPPNEPVDGKQAADLTSLRDDLPMDEWVRRREKQLADKRAAGH